MKRPLILLFTSISLLNGAGCVSTTSTGTTVAATSSLEVEARKQTNQLKTLLNLSEMQADKVYIATLTHLKTTSRLRQMGDMSKISAADEAYRQELAKILTNEQWGQYQISKGNG
ncbi:MAG: hypothetical protein ACK4R6_04905 [Spirosomataceae bacterium]